MKVKASIPVRLNLVEPLGHKPTAMRTEGTASLRTGLPCAVAPLIGASLRQGDVDSTTRRPTTPTTPGTRTPTATRTSTTSPPLAEAWPSADSDLFEQLAVAWRDCRRGKSTSASSLAFEAHLEANLYRLYEELSTCTYRPGRTTCFPITRPRVREVWAAEFPDRVVHHLLYNKIAARFIASFTADSCACIPGRGTLYAAERLEHQIRSVTENWSHDAFYLKCDLANFFVSIKKAVLLEQLAAKVTEPWWLWLTEAVLMHDPRADVDLRGRPEELARIPAHKSLFNVPASQGLPIGNLSSQFFANVLLNSLDQFVKHKLRAPTYIRYVDDFILLNRSRSWLVDAHAEIEAFLPARLGVRLNPRKTIIQPVARGVDFVGHVIKPWCRSTRRGTVAHAIERIRTVDDADLQQIANSYFGLLGQASHSHSDRALLANAVRRRGRSIKADFTKTYA